MEEGGERELLPAVRRQTSRLPPLFYTGIERMKKMERGEEWGARGLGSDRCGSLVLSSTKEDIEKENDK